MNTPKLRSLTVAVGLATAVMAAPRDPASHPHIEPIMSLRPVAADGSAYELLIYGDIGDSWWGESVTAQSVAEQLFSIYTPQRCVRPVGRSQF